MTIRTSIARLRVDQVEYLSILSAPMMGDSDDVVLVIKGFSSFLTLASSALRKACSSPGMEISEAFVKNSRPLSQLNSARSFGCRLRVARTDAFWSSRRISTGPGKRPFVLSGCDSLHRCEIFSFHCRRSPGRLSNQYRILYL